MGSTASLARGDRRFTDLVHPPPPLDSCQGQIPNVNGRQGVKGIGDPRQLARIKKGRSFCSKQTLARCRDAELEPDALIGKGPASAHFLLLAASGLVLGLLRLLDTTAGVGLGAGNRTTIALLAGGGIDLGAGSASTK